jgi:hypothetical protein
MSTITNPTPATIILPSLADRAVAEVGAGLADKLSWLKTAYGKTYRKIKEVDGREVAFPAIYTDDGNYLSMLPDAHLENYCFFVLDDGAQVDYQNRRNVTFDVIASIIFCYDLRTVLPVARRLAEIHPRKREIRSD